MPRNRNLGRRGGCAARVVVGLHAGNLVELGGWLHRALELVDDDRLIVEQHIGAGPAELAAQLFADVDIVLLDGHGTPSAWPPRMCGLELDLATLQRSSGQPGIQAPVLIVGACRAGGPNIATALRRCLVRPSTLLVASRRPTYKNHGTRVFPQVLRALARLGPSPDPATAFEQLRGLAVLGGEDPRGWGASLLHQVTPR